MIDVPSSWVERDEGALRRATSSDPDWPRQRCRRVRRDARGVTFPPLLRRSSSARGPGFGLGLGLLAQSEFETTERVGGSYAPPEEITTVDQYRGRHAFELGEVARPEGVGLARGDHQVGS